MEDGLQILGRNKSATEESTVANLALESINANIIEAGINVIKTNKICIKKTYEVAYKSIEALNNNVRDLKPCKNTLEAKPYKSIMKVLENDGLQKAALSSVYNYH